LTVDGADKLPDVPGPILLEDSLPCNAEGRAQGIESRFGGDGLPTPIINRHVVVGDGGDQIPVKVDGRRVSLSVDGDSGVCAGPVAVALNGSDHLGFDFAHGSFG